MAALWPLITGCWAFDVGCWMFLQPIDPTNPMNGLTWLHLSDWHQKGRDFDRNVVRDALIRDLRERIASLLRLRMQQPPQAA